MPSQSSFLNFPQLRCWNHIVRDVTRWLRSHGVPSHDVSIYLSNIRVLFYLPTEEEYKSTLAEMKCRWSAPFSDYYTTNILTFIQLIDGPLSPTGFMTLTVV